MGLDENETPFAFATCQPPLHVEWLLSDHQSGQLLSPLRHTGLDSLPDSSQFTARFKALQAGHSSLKVIIRATQSDSSQLSQDELVDEVSIQVYESLQLINPSKTSGHFLLMMPNTQLDLKTNLDSSASLDYVVEAATSVVVPDSKGTIRSDTSLGQSALILTAVNSHGVSQSFNVLVEVSFSKPHRTAVFTNLCCFCSFNCLFIYLFIVIIIIIGIANYRCVPYPTWCWLLRPFWIRNRRCGCWPSREDLNWTFICRTLTRWAERSTVSAISWISDRADLIWWESTTIRIILV